MFLIFLGALLDIFEIRKSRKGVLLKEHGLKICERH